MSKDALPSVAVESALLVLAWFAVHPSSMLEAKPTLRFGTQQLIESFGYPVENHTVVTKDCYILRLFRIPKPGGIPVFFMHGLLDSSATWPVIGPGKALLFMLSDFGYDVWLGNARGTTESRRNCKLDPDRDVKFWDFSWHEIGKYDLPASIDFILSYTSQHDLHYIGHSQGATVYLVMASEAKNMMGKIRTANLLAPVAPLRGIRSIPFRVLFTVNWSVARSLLGVPRVMEVLPHSTLYSALAQTYCKPQDFTSDICQGVLSVTVGPGQVDKELYPQLLANVPAGASWKQFAHYQQLLNYSRGVFRKFDYGPVTNLARYGSEAAPDYDLSLVGCNTALVYSPSDSVADKSDTEFIKRNAACSTVVEVADPNFNHVDFLAGKDVKTLVNDGVASRIRSFDGSSPPQS